MSSIGTPELESSVTKPVVEHEPRRESLAIMVRKSDVYLLP